MLLCSGKNCLHPGCKEGSYQIFVCFGWSKSGLEEGVLSGTRIRVPLRFCGQAVLGRGPVRDLEGKN